MMSECRIIAILQHLPIDKTRRFDYDKGEGNVRITKLYEDDVQMSRRRMRKNENILRVHAPIIYFV